jgi:hypothetical protein
VYPFGGLLTEVGRQCPRVLVNLEETGMVTGIAVLTILAELCSVRPVTA